MNLRDFLAMYWGNNLITIYEHQADYEHNCFNEMTTSDIYDSPQFKDIADNDVVRFDIDKQGNIIIYTVEHGYFLMEFEFDEKKLKENEPDLTMEQCYKWLDEICQDTYFEKIGKGKYVLNRPDENIVGSLLVLSGRFDRQSWLYPNLRKWTTWCMEEGEQNALKAMYYDELNKK